MKIIFFVACFLILSLITSTFGQDSINHQSLFPAGISVGYGQGLYSVKDEYISKEKYSGTIPHLEIKWTKYHGNYGYILGLDFQNSSRIKNNNVSADIYQFTINQGFLYPLPEFSLFSKEVYLYLGPSTDLYFFFNKQKIAISGFDYASSFACLLSLGINSEFIIPFKNNITIESSLGFSVLSLGFRMVNDEDNNDESPAKLLTLFSGTNGSFKFGIRYYLLNNVSLKLAYRFQLTRISSWTPLLSASDDLILSLTYGF
jgi:hypothetical protein